MLTASTPLFQTNDYALAAFLVVKRFGLHHVESNAFHELVFCFEPGPELTKALAEYTADGPVPVRQYFYTLKKVKSLIMNAKGYSNGKSESLSL
jgi:hypothetical protein